MNIKNLYKKCDGQECNIKEKRFGTAFTDKMFFAEYKDGKWNEPVIKNVEPFQFSPSALVLHYAQEIFEGQKAFKWSDGSVVLFRPEMNVKRFNRSATRMSMPNVDETLFMNALETLIWEERSLIPPSEEGHSLYIRPAMIAVDPMLGVRSGANFYFFIISSPYGSYFPEGFNPVKIWVSDNDVRTIRGGVGEAKTGANYAATLNTMIKVREKGYSQVLWLDGVELKYVEEFSTMNAFFVEGGKLITPALTGGILAGITRDSVITVARDMGIKVEERKVSMSEICEGVENGKITECFGTGTACVITPVGQLGYKGKDYVIGGFKTGEITQKIYDVITGIQSGKIKDKFGWIKKINK